MSKIRTYRWDWFDKVQMWRGGARNQRITRQLAQGDVIQYLFHIRRFTHCVEARTLSQMEYVPADYLSRQQLATIEYRESAT